MSRTAGLRAFSEAFSITERDAICRCNLMPTVSSSAFVTGALNLVSARLNWANMTVQSPPIRDTAIAKLY